MPTATLAVRQQGDVPDDDLCAKDLLPGVLVIPGARRQTTLDEELDALGRVVADNLRGSLVSNQIVPLGLVLLLAALVLVALCGCQ